MDEGVRPTRRVVTGHDEHGRSRVVWDGPAPNAINAPSRPGGGMLDLWVFRNSPAPLAGERDDGHLPYDFEPPGNGAHLRIVQSPALPGRLRRAARARAAPAARWHLGPRRPAHPQDADGRLRHRARERILVLDNGDKLMQAGDVVVQLGNWHGWSASRRTPNRMAFIMIGAQFER